jgi:hypothetical protein
MKRTRTIAAPPQIATTTDILKTIPSLNLRIISYLNRTVPGEADQSYWVPRDMLSKDGNTLILWREAGEGSIAYNVPGWFPWHDGMFGGCCQTLGAALGWVRRAMDIRVGKAQHF